MIYSKEQIGKTIKAERIKRGLTQEKIGELIGVTGKQISSYEAGNLIPPMDVLLKYCDIFDCELGFLLNEESYTNGTKLLTTIEDTLGINPASVNSLIKITGAENSCLDFGYNSKNHRRILNKLLSSPAFLDFYTRFAELDRMVECKKNIWTKLEEKYSKESIELAFAYHSSSTDYLNDPNAEKLEDNMYEILNAIEDSIDESADCMLSIKIARYELNEALVKLINELYPE